MKISLIFIYLKYCRFNLPLMICIHKETVIFSEMVVKIVMEILSLHPFQIFRTIRMNYAYQLSVKLFEHIVSYFELPQPKIYQSWFFYRNYWFFVHSFFQYRFLKTLGNFTNHFFRIYKLVVSKTFHKQIKRDVN